MTEPVFWRLIWKEYRMLRSFWIALAVITLVIQLFMVNMPSNWYDALPTFLFGIALGVPALYALGCGATLFATEHEERTFAFLRALPISVGRLFVSKLTFAVLSTLALLCLLWPIAWFLADGRFPVREGHWVLWCLCGPAWVEFLAWGMFFSLLSTRPLKAAILGIAAASIVFQVLIALFDKTGRYGVYMEPVVAIVVYRVAIGALILLVDAWLARRWLREAPPGLSPVTALLRRREAAALARQEAFAALADSAPSPRRRMLARLVWQQWRQSFRMNATFAAVAVGLVCFFAWLAPSRSPIYQISLPASLIFASLVGSCVFLADQNGRSFRFFAEHGVRSTTVWWSRHIVGMGIVLLMSAVVGVPTRAWEIVRYSHEPLAILGLWLAMAYASGQLCSMLLRSGILSGFLGLVLAGVVFAWSLMMVEFGIGLLWSVAPIPLVMMLATWLRSRHWVLERNTPKAWLQVVVSLGVPAAILLTAVPMYRVYEIPEVDPGFSIEAFARPATAEERATADMYRRARDLLVARPKVVVGDVTNASDDTTGQPVDPQEALRAPLTAEDRAWIGANEKSIALVLEASARGACIFTDPTSSNYGLSAPDFAIKLGRLLSAHARLLEEEGKLDEALERYLAGLRLSLHVREHGLILDQLIASATEELVYDRLPFWAAHADQTPERIGRAIEQLRKITGGLPPKAEAIKAEYIRYHRFFSGDPEAFDLFSGTEEEARTIALMWNLMRWEFTRARRLLDVRIKSDIQWLNRCQSALQRGTTLSDLGKAKTTDEMEAWQRNTALITRIYFWSDGLVEQEYKIETRRRATRLILALVAWKLEHGELPETLDELIGAGLERLPIDPYSGRPFRYFSEGLPTPLVWSSQSYSKKFVVPVGAPFVWSAGRKAVATDLEVLKAGWPFPLP